MGQYVIDVRGAPLRIRSLRGSFPMKQLRLDVRLSRNRQILGLCSTPMILVMEALRRRKTYDEHRIVGTITLGHVRDHPAFEEDGAHY